MLQRLFHITTSVLLALTCLTTYADDWSRFRGPEGSGVARDFQKGILPINWSPKANLGWKTELPGPGASSPIIVDGKVKLRAACTINFPPELRRDLCYVSENSQFRFCILGANAQFRRHY